MSAADRAGMALAVVAMLIVGSSVAASAALTDYPVWSGQAMRYAAGTAVLAVLLRRQRRAAPAYEAPGRLTTSETLRLGALALTGLVAFNYCIVVGARHADPSTIGVVIGVTPLVLAVAGPLLEGRRPSRRVVAAAAVVVAGAAVVEGFGRTTVLGALLAVGALAGEVLFSLLAASLLARLGALRLSTYVCGLAVPMLAVLAVVSAERLRVPTLPEALALAWIALAVTVVAFLGWYEALRRLGVERVAVFPGLIPVGALLSAVVLGTGRPSAVEVTGTVIVMLGVVAGLRDRPAHASA